MNLVILPALSKPGAGLNESFPACTNSNHYFKFTTQGLLKPVDRFLCMVLDFFVHATESNFAAWNWAEFLVTLTPVYIHALEASTTAKRGFWVLLIPFIVSALGQVMGLGVTFPLLGLPLYALSGASKPAPRETSVAMARAIVFTCLLFLLPNVLFFLFPHGSALWVWTACIFQFSVPLTFLAPFGIAMCCRNPGESRRNRARAHALLLFLYGISLGACLLAHVVLTLRFAQQSSWDVNATFSLFNEAWSDMKVRFLLVDHGSCLLTIVLMIILDGGFSGLFLVLFLSPFLSVGGALSVFYARTHINWLVEDPLKQEKIRNQKGKRE